MSVFINSYGRNTDFFIQVLTFKMHIFAVFNSALHIFVVMTEDLKKDFEEYLFDINRSIFNLSSNRPQVYIRAMYICSGLASMAEWVFCSK